MEALTADRGTTEDQLDARLYAIAEDNRWRLTGEIQDPSHSDPSKPSEACHSWFQVDQMLYAGLPVDESIFEIEGKTVVGVEKLGLRVVLDKDG